jgi:DNA-binding GntR family transcriptional regulator
MDTTLTKTPAADRVYAHVKAAILDRTYEGGALLTEGEVADAVGVSRTPVREALLRLQAEGLLRLYPKKGALVLPVSAQEVEDVLEARALVETFTAGKAYAHRQSLAATLEPLLEEMRRHRDSAEPRALMEADRVFHAAIVEAAGNAVLTRFYTGLRDRQLCMGVAAMRAEPEWMAQVVDEHAAILAALKQGDEEAFTARVSSHVGAVAGRLRSLR